MLLLSNSGATDEIVRILPLLKARNELDSWASKEAAFLANNWVLLFSALALQVAAQKDDHVTLAGADAAAGGVQGVAW